MKKKMMAQLDLRNYDHQTLISNASKLLAKFVTFCLYLVEIEIQIQDLMW